MASAGNLIMISQSLGPWPNPDTKHDIIYES